MYYSYRRAEERLAKRILEKSPSVAVLTHEVVLLVGVVERVHAVQNLGNSRPPSAIFADKLFPRRRSERKQSRVRHHVY